MVKCWPDLDLVSILQGTIKLICGMNLCLKVSLWMNLSQDDICKIIYMQIYAKWYNIKIIIYMQHTWRGSLHIYILLLLHPRFAGLVLEGALALSPTLPAT